MQSRLQSANPRLRQLFSEICVQEGARDFTPQCQCCPDCHAWRPSSGCSKCGPKRPVQKAEGSFKGDGRFWVPVQRGRCRIATTTQAASEGQGERQASKGSKLGSSMEIRGRDGPPSAVWLLTYAIESSTAVRRCPARLSELCITWQILVCRVGQQLLAVYRSTDNHQLFHMQVISRITCKDAVWKHTMMPW